MTDLDHAATIRRTQPQGSLRNTGATNEYSRQMSEKHRPPLVRIADLPEAGDFAGRVGEIFGWSIPSSSGVAPVIGSAFGGSAREDFAYSVYFEDTGEQHWFSRHLIETLRGGNV